MKALVIDEPWISKILRGEKTWEMRSSRAQVRGLIALVRKGSGSVVGVARIIDCVGPLDLAQLATNSAKHQVSMVEFESGRAAKWNIAWVLSDAQELARPIPYKHPNGAVVWVNLDPDVEREVLGHLGPATHHLSPAAPREAEAAPRKEVHANAEVSIVPDHVSVPVAKDGTWFGPHLSRGGAFTIGAKGEEQAIHGFEKALAMLKAMGTPRWRRPNSNGNWGIVTGTGWAKLGRTIRD